MHKVYHKVVEICISIFVFNNSCLKVNEREKYKALAREKNDLSFRK
jgi:hypothetical protein